MWASIYLPNGRILSRVRVSVVAVSALALVASCAKFEAVDPPDAGAADGSSTSSSGGADSSSGGSSGMPFDAGPSACGRVLLDDPFDDAWKTDWLRLGDAAQGILTIDDSNPFRGRSALRARRAEGATGIAHLQFTVANRPKVLCLAGMVRIDARGMGEVDFFGMDAPSSVPQQSIGLVHAATKGFVLQFPGANGTEQVPIEVDMKTWMPVTFEVTLGANPMLKAKVGAKPSRDFVLDKAWPRSTILVQVGIYFVGMANTAPTDDWVVRYDDARIAVADP